MAARQVTLNPADMGLFVPAFQLSGVPELQEPDSLVLPIGWYQPGKRVQIYTSLTETVKLTALLEKGANFERVTLSASRCFNGVRRKSEPVRRKSGLMHAFNFPFTLTAA